MAAPREVTARPPSAAATADVAGATRTSDAADLAAPDTAETAPVPGGVVHRREGQPFEVHLDVFSGPFDLLLGLIAKHKLDVTEIALAKVTDEFVAHIRAAQASSRDWDLSEASEFLLVAATLLDLKASRLLPTQREEDEEDLALIEARDLLFARLLQYRAFKQVAAELGERMSTVGRIFPRDVGVEEGFTRLLPELVMGVAPEQLAAIAAQAMLPKPPPTVGTDHLHAGHVSVREQAGLVVARLRRQSQCSFRELVADADSTLVIVARFLALLELFREGVLAFSQDEALGGLDVRWDGPAHGAVGATEIGSEFDGPVPPDAAEGPEPGGER